VCQGCAQFKFVLLEPGEKFLWWLREMRTDGSWAANEKISSGIDSGNPF
jgi:hypothetical protein